jgi:myo-inositol-1-phosphate synthase
MNQYEQFLFLLSLVSRKGMIMNTDVAVCAISLLPVSLWRESTCIRHLRKIGGPIIPASAYFMKHPPEQIRDVEAREKLEEFIEGA